MKKHPILAGWIRHLVEAVDPVCVVVFPSQGGARSRKVWAANVLHLLQFLFYNFLKFSQHLFYICWKKTVWLKPSAGTVCMLIAEVPFPWSKTKWSFNQVKAVELLSWAIEFDPFSRKVREWVKGKLICLRVVLGGWVGPVTGDGSVEWERGKFDSRGTTLAGLDT